MDLHYCGDDLLVDASHQVFIVKAGRCFFNNGDESITGATHAPPISSNIINITDTKIRVIMSHLRLCCQNVELYSY